jgi:benzoyl-CoA reductase/2-hydroxyglutaryl-CoA dehydratase subunit BcrC/BadD/HgdB
MAEPAGKNVVGITTTIPIEAVFAAGCTPMDLNNRFITAPDPEAEIARAEAHGFPAATCAWVKGIYGTVHRLGIRRLVGVVRGDCSETEALLEILESEGVEVLPFSYPEHPDPVAMQASIDRLCGALGTTPAAAEEEKQRLDAVRELVHACDRRAWEENGLGGPALFDLLVNASDFRGAPDAYAAEARARLKAAPDTERASGGPRLGYLGVPPIHGDLIAVLERHGAQVVFCEIPRQFALPATGRPLAQSYTAYTYPYGAAARVADIRQQSRRRGLEGLVHYVQSFCHRRLHDRLIREGVDLPILTLEGDRPGPVDPRTETRIEAFLEMLA